MRIYYLKMITPEGLLQKRFISLPFNNYMAALRYMEKNKNIVINIRALPVYIGCWIKYLLPGEVNIKRKQLAEAFNNIAILLNSGSSLAESVSEVSQDTNNELLKQSLYLIHHDLQSGLEFYKALQRQQDYYPDTVINLVRTGQETGRMSDMCARVSRYYQNIDRIVSRTKRALLYPAISLVMVMAVVVVWFVYVIPKILKLFENAGVALPLETKLLVFLSNFFQEYFLICLLFLVVGLSGIYLLHRLFYSVKKIIDSAILRIPILGDFIKTSEGARISQNLEVLMESEVELSRAFGIISHTVVNVELKERIQLAWDKIKKGSSISSGLSRAKALEPFALRMLSVGDGTDKIKEQAAYVANYYQDKLEGKLDILLKMIEPVLITILGIMFALIVWGLFLPIYELIGNIA